MEPNLKKKIKRTTCKFLLKNEIENKNSISQKDPK